MSSFRNMKQDLADLSGKSVDGVSMKRLAPMFAKKIVAAKNAVEEDNIPLPFIENIRQAVAKTLEAEADQMISGLPIASVFDALQIVKSCKTASSDAGLRALAGMLSTMWKRDRSAQITADKFLTLRNYFVREFPKSKVGEVMDKVAAEGYAQLHLSELVDIASRVATQQDFEYEMTRAGLDGQQPHQKKAREFVLALVNDADADADADVEADVEADVDEDAGADVEAEKSEWYEEQEGKLQKERSRFMGRRRRRSQMDSMAMVEETIQSIGDNSDANNFAVDLAKGITQWDEVEVVANEFRDEFSDNGYPEMTDEDWAEVAEAFKDGEYFDEEGNVVEARRRARRPFQDKEAPLTKEGEPDHGAMVQNTVQVLTKDPEEYNYFLDMVNLIEDWDDVSSIAQDLRDEFDGFGYDEMTDEDWVELAEEFRDEGYTEAQRRGGRPSPNKDADAEGLPQHSLSDGPPAENVVEDADVFGMWGKGAQVEPYDLDSLKEEFGGGPSSTKEDKALMEDVDREIADEQAIWAEMAEMFPGWVLGDLKDVAVSVAPDMDPEEQEVQEVYQELLSKKAQMRGEIPSGLPEDGEIIKGLVTIIWGSSWADAVEERADKGLDAPSLAGTKIEEVMPEIPQEAYNLAQELYREIESTNGLLLAEFIPPGETEDYDREWFGNDLAFESMGSGVAWSDSHEDHGLEIPNTLESGLSDLQWQAEEGLAAEYGGSVEDEEE